MNTKVYVNVRNGNKFLEVKKTKCSHFYIRQFMFWKENGVINYTGKQNGAYSRVTRKYILDDLLKDYRLYGKREK